MTTSDAVPAESGSVDRVVARADRMQRVRNRMAELDVDALLLSLGADLPWCSGYEAMPLERPTVLVLPADGEATLVVPFLEAPRVQADDRLFRLRPWREDEDAVAIVADLVGRRATLAISDRSFASLVLQLQGALSGRSWQAASAITGPIRAVKDAVEVSALTAAAQAADVVAGALIKGEIPLIGRSEAAVSAEIGARLIAQGHQRVNFAIVGSGPNAASPHHSPGRRIIGRGEFIVCDFGGTYQLGDDVGYCSDITRTVVTGEPDPEFVDLYHVLEDAQYAAVNAVVPGISCEGVDQVGRKMITDSGYGQYFIHRTGHGIGLEEHEDPYIVQGNTDLVREGHAFSIEPGIYVPGRFGARIEDIIVATRGGAEALNTVDHSLHVVEV